MGADLPKPAASLTDVLRHRAREQPDDRAYVFLSDRGAEDAVLTFGTLAAKAAGVATRLRQQADPGDRALLLFQPGLDFIVGFFGCLMAGIIAVPMMTPRRQGTRDASRAIVADCGPRLALTSRALLTTRPDIVERYRARDIAWMAVDDADPAAPEDVGPMTEARDPAFLQYTSGSTSAPKGVIVTHANLLANLAMIQQALGNGRRSTYVSWIPLYHDMGLILSCLETIHLGAMNVMMAPASFMQRPLVWLRAIGQYRAEVSCAPNFAYDLCVDRFRADQMAGIDLSHWAVALNGAEPVRAATLDRFAATFAPYGFSRAALYPAYGMAEATLLISGGRRGRLAPRKVLEASGQMLVGCGRSVEGGRIAIVDPETLERQPPDRLGEIWVGGPHVAAGYWRNPGASTAAFAARIKGEERLAWLRTGDLGLLDPQGELYITGRIKDLIIIRGTNHYPHDIEDSVQNADPDLRRGCGAAFTAAEADDDDALVIVQEVERGFLGRTTPDALAGRIREVVAAEHEVSARHVVLIRPGTLPKTTSGKIQRSLTRRLWQDGDLALIDEAF